MKALMPYIVKVIKMHEIAIVCIQHSHDTISCDMSVTCFILENACMITIWKRKCFTKLTKGNGVKDQSYPMRNILTVL